jgi:hypothetical protein
MIVIKCRGENAFGGRTSDIYVLEDFNTLDELYTYIKTNQPVKAKQPTRYYKNSIIEKESLVDQLVYLNNYLHIEEVYHYVMSSDEIEYIEQNIWKGCKHNDGSLRGALSCSYVEKNKGCWNYTESFKLIKKLLSKFK